jgi:hypothetical protein
VSVDEGDRWGTELAARLAVQVLGWLADAPRRTALNLNVPALPPEELGPVRWATLDKFGRMRAAVESVSCGMQFEFRNTDAELEPDSDTALLAAGHPTLTALAGLGIVQPGEVVERLEEITARLTVPAATSANRAEVVPDGRRVPGQR